MSTAEYWQRVITMAQRDFIAFEDGYLRYWPDKINGALSAADLRIIADELDRRNAPWDAQVNSYFQKEGGR